MQDHEHEPDGKFLSELYTGLSQEQPSSALDEKIQAAARKAVAADTDFAATQPSGSFLAKWRAPFSLAAVIVLSVTLVVMIERERPYSLTSLPEKPRIENKAAQTLPAETQTRAPEADQSEPGLHPDSQSEAVKFEAKQPETKTQLAENLQKKPAAAVEHHEDPGEAARAQAAREKKQDDSQRRLLASPAPLAESADGGSEALAVKKAAPVVKTETAKPAPVLDAKAKPVEPDQDETGQALAPDAPASDSRTTITRQMQDLATAPVETQNTELQQTTSAVAEEQKVAEEMVGTAMTKAPAQVAEQENLPVSPAQSAQLAPVDQESQDQQCRQMTAQDCLASTLCILQQQGNSTTYQCRAAQNACEQDFAQSRHTQEDCEHQPGCVYVPAYCYCAPGQACPCAEGPPAMCMPKPVAD